MRLPVEILAKVDKWAADNEASRSDAIRTLLEQALAVAPKRAMAKWKE